MEITFKAQEYTADDSFINSEYRIKGDSSNGWEIFRNDEKHLQLGPGYELLKTLSCGICSTDIDRRFLPFDLPQVTGHEVIAQRMDSKQLYAIEINDTPMARGDKELDSFSRAGIHTHSPGRMVLGIDRLPGGFGPYLLAPINAIVSLDGIDENAAVLIEPFAAALQAVIASPPKEGDEVVVLGPRRLGALLISALVAYRESTGGKFRIGALAKYDKNIQLCLTLGADFGVNIVQTDEATLKGNYDIVYDTTGSVSGFETALQLSRREVHLKSTNGQQMCEINGLTAFVVDELSLLPFSQTNLEFKWPGDTRNNREIFVAQMVPSPKIENPDLNVIDTSIQQAEQMLTKAPFLDGLPRFDIAVASSIEEIDGIIRPSKDHENSLVRPRGAILFKGKSKGNKLLDFLNNGGQLRSSRCGDFHKAIQILKENPDTAFNLSHYLISHMFPANELTTAFEYAKRKESVKVIIKH